MGQAPRPDIVKLFSRYSSNIKLLVLGGLDNLSAKKIDGLTTGPRVYPLLTRLRNGSTQEISLHRLKPLLEKRIVDFEAKSFSTIILWCSGNFSNLQSKSLLIYPNRLMKAFANALYINGCLDIVIPNIGQREYAKDHWEKNGFHVRTIIVNPFQKGALDSAKSQLAEVTGNAVILECMGFSPGDALKIRRICGRPVICPQSLVVRIVAEIAGIFNILP